MKVRCIKLKIEDEELWENDAEGFLEVGEEYFVSAIRILNNYVYYDIDFSSKFLLFPNRMFEVLSNTVPSIWRVKVFDEGEILIGPELFFEEYFYDNYSEGYDYETEEYEKIRPLLEVD